MDDILQSAIDTGKSSFGKHFRMLADISTAAIFEYDLTLQNFSLLVNTTQHFGINETEFAECIKFHAYTSIEALLQDFLHPDDIPTALDAHAMIASKHTVRYMARLKNANGTYIWKNIYYNINSDAESGQMFLSGYIVDIRDAKIYKGILEHFIHSIDHSFLCLDVNTDNYILFGKHEGRSPILAIGSNYSRSIVDYTNTYVAPEDREVCIAQMQISRITEVLQTKVHHTFSLNSRDPVTGNSRKYLKYSSYDKNQGLVIVTVGDQTRQFTDELEYAKIIKEALSQGSTDPLTGLYNRHSGEQLIKKTLESSTGSHHALMLLNIGHFESLTSSVGESFGEAVLADVALRLKRLFRNNDVLARIDDTQFMLFMADVSEEAAAVRKIDDIRRVLYETCPDSCSQSNLSCSVGLVYINGRPSFDTVLRNAHASLHTALQAGDNTFHIHQEKNSVTCTMPAMTETEESRTALVMQLKERIFELLYSSSDFEQGIRMSLALIGGMLDMSRVYIFENSDNNYSTSNTYEWCSESVNSELHNLQNLPFSSVNYATLLDVNGILNCPNINTIRGTLYEILFRQGIQSFLHVPIKDGNEIIGFVGFDECRLPRTFTATEIDTLSFAAKIIGTFLRKKRMTDLVNVAIQDKVEALDNLPSYMYVLDQEYRLLYMNKMVNMLVPAALVGMKCHAALIGLDEPCPGCPAMRCDHGRCSVEMYNPRYNLWVISSAARISWAGQKDTVLVSCQDITSFKIMRTIH